MNWYRTLRYPMLYLGLVVVAEVVTGYYRPQAGIVMHVGILIGLLVHSAFVANKELADFLASLSLAPLIRVFSLSTPLIQFSHISWFLMISVPVFIGVFTCVHLQKIAPKEVALSPPPRRHMPLQLGVIALALPVGFLEYQVLKPSPTVEFSFPLLIAPALVFLVCSGFLEELVFRGLMQHTATRLAGFSGLVFVSVLFGALHITNLTVLDAVLAGSVGFAFALVVRKTGSIWAVSLAHGTINIGLFLIAPHIIG